MSSKGEQTRNEIIEAAKTLFYHRGYNQTSFSNIVDQTGIRRGNINHYFKSKHDILDAVLEQRVSEFTALILDWEKQHRDPKDRLHCFVRMVASNRVDLTRYGCPIGTLSAELGKESSDLHDAARSLFDVFIDWLAEQFKTLGSSPRQAHARALHLLGRTEGISVIAHVYHDAALVTNEVKTLGKWIDEL